MLLRSKNRSLHQSQAFFFYFLKSKRQSRSSRSLRFSWLMRSLRPVRSSGSLMYSNLSTRWPTSFNLMTWKRKFLNEIQENFKLKMVSCRTEAVEAEWGQKNLKIFIWHKFPLFRSTKSLLNWRRTTYFSLSGQIET